ncbi:unnamed protein product [Vicia faba]|uniref:Uncharacterized protein n=1 Tax=Vicia faba TaxID=3906 RepID=A0AAV0ZU81_VICFA|nr:unnamed protein product [Vicia faba]
MNEYWKRSGQIPAFGNRDIANELTITQYFENARQAGLIHYSSPSGETDLYVVDHKKPVRKAKRIRDRRYTKWFEYFGRFRHRIARVHCSILGTTAPILLTVEHFSSLAAYSGCLSAGNMMVNKNYN